MKRFASQRLLPAAALLAVGACPLYTDPINHPPEQVVILGPNGQSRNMPISFTTSAFDPDNDPLTYEWAHKAGPCAGAPMPPVEATGMTFEVLVTELGKFCVWLKVTDRYGADVTAVPLEAVAVNSAPTAIITRQQPGGNTLGPFPLYSDFRFSATGSSDRDRDPFSRSWTLAAFPDQSQARLVDCAPTDPVNMAACFHADIKGDYQVRLSVSDGTATGEQTVSVTVADDAPPCLIAEGTDLPMRDGANPAEAQLFSVTVADDGDPWPAANPSYGAAGFPAFTWRIKRNSGAWQIVTGFNLPTLSLPPGELSVGDQADVRVEVTDRVVTRSLAACGDEPACRLVPGCAQRLTWKVAFR